jgi:hypothetical protein
MLKPADWGGEVDELQNASGYPLFKRADLRWTLPKVWSKDQRLPTFDADRPVLYALVRDHGNAATRDHIEYIGLTTSPKTRFGNHSTAKKIVAKRGTVRFSYAPIEFVRGRNRIAREKQALEEDEHLLIWAVGEHLVNQKKQYSLPGMGVNGGNAWQIVNTGYRFGGRMPREIVFPWMLVQPGRDRTARPRVG